MTAVGASTDIMDQTASRMKIVHESPFMTSMIRSGRSISEY